MTEDDKKIEKVLTRGVANILPSKKELADLMAKKKITLYQGFDPSSKNLHIGNWIGIRKLAQFQELGHQVIFLIGDFTGMIGDPTDKSAARKKMSKKQALENAKDYTKQTGKTLRFTGPNAAKVLFNSEWLAKLSFEEVVELASNFTVQQMLERDFFQDRLKENKPIYLHEFFYPLMQSFDCVNMDVDLEIGGNDQLFNMLAGRNLMKALKNKEKCVLTMKLLTDPSGEKMGKSERNVINLSCAPEDMYGQLMALPDSLLELTLELLTDLSMELAKELGALELKKKIANDVVRQLHGGAEAEKAQKDFETTFQEKKPLFRDVNATNPTLVDVVSEYSESKSEAKRKIMQGAVDVDNKPETNPLKELEKGTEIKIGKKTFIKISDKK